ncbi:MAG: recombination mediator RecR [Ezakiella sp.]|nr:recombination mediator RecR [Ezakiella sp.]MDD7471424.1 recombination mediator RecR [Bacillota bacterium]MDY3922921.1 recombination mediator RecR [Ezakiella sp.]
MSDNIIENLTDHLAKFPGVGRKTAKRLAYYIVDLSDEEASGLIDAIKLAKSGVTKCKICGNYSEKEICDICASEYRDCSKLMVVQNPKDVDSFEKSKVYDGKYFVLDEEEINPLKGIGAKEIGLDRLEQLLNENYEIKEVILALNGNVMSSQTGLLIKAAAKKSGKEVTRISQGIPSGGVLEYFDTDTIRAAFLDRKEF